jgi:uncharacterized DUF497 family protein
MPDVISGQFEWDADKNRTNREKHRIAFEDASVLFDQPHLKLRSADHGETRWIALGAVEGRMIAVIYTQRQERIRLISARAARKNERKIYEEHIGRPP